MRKLLILIPLLAVLASCTEYNKVLKSRDVDYKFGYAKRAYEEKRYLQSITLLNEIYTPLRGTAKGEEALYLLAMSHFQNKDYENANEFFQTYYQRYPKGKYAEPAHFYSGYGFYLDSPDPQLDQTYTIKAIRELSEFIEKYPKSAWTEDAEKAIFEMQDKLTLKELQNAQLYYNLGNFLGNNYQSAVIVAQNAIKDYPFSKYREEFEFLILKSKYQMAKNSVSEKMEERYNDVLDEFYSFNNNFPESKHAKEAQTIQKIAQSHVRKN